MNQAWRNHLLAAGAVLAALAAAAPAAAVEARVPVEQFTLDNGMKFLLVRRPEQATVMSGWVAKVGSANERPGITGVAHFFEHMMFKGTRTIGTKDAARDAEIIAEQEKLQERIRALYAVQRERYRLGEIDDVFDPKNRPQELVDLEAQFQKLVEEQRALMVKDEYDKIYTAAGATGMNAGTDRDWTFYFVTVPANKLELWFWMESDRLSQPVFREFYSERDVVQEERRQSLEATPTGRFEEQLNSIFWTSHPYNWETIGWMSDLKMLSLADARDFFATYYAPNNLTAALVGNFDPAEVKELAQRYFGRIPRGSKPVPDVVTLEVPQIAERRMDAECDCQPQVTIQYHTVPFRHRDSYALDVLQEVLNGRSGRLNKSLVLDRGIAASAAASQSSLKYAGYFSLEAETRGDAKPADLEAALVAELERLKTEPVPAEELQKVKNQIAAAAFRNLENPFWLMLQLLLYEGWGDWEYINFWADKTLAVTAEDVQRVAQKYFTPENRTVATYLRKAGTAAEEVPPEVAALPPEMRQHVLAQIRQLREVTDPQMLEGGLAQLAQQKGAAPAEVRPALEAIEKAMQARLAELRAAAGKK